GTGRTFNVQFDATGATADSTYQDTLRITTSDEALPGAAAQSTLTVVLRAHTEAGSVDVPGGAPGARRTWRSRSSTSRAAGWRPWRAARGRQEPTRCTGPRPVTTARGSAPVST